VPSWPTLGHLVNKSSTIKWNSTEEN
jgi:hypothetical protein